MSIKVKKVSGDGKVKLDSFLKSVGNKVGKVGWLKGIAYDDAKQTKVAEVAVTNEFGDPSRHIPARPFMRPTIAEKQNEWRAIALRASMEVLKGAKPSTYVMELIGLKAAGDIKKTISKIWSPPLSERTINERLKRRGNKKITKSLTKPLIDTGYMINTLTNSVEDE